MRNKGTFAAPFNFEVKTQEALDPRVIVSTKADLINKETWPYDDDTLYLYNGLVVAVSEDKAIYMLTDLTKALEVDYSGWKQLDVAAAVATEIIDNLTTQSTTAALSANQGYILDGKITELDKKLSAIYNYKGVKETYAELPTDATTGDVYFVNEAYDPNPAGISYVWNGTAWEPLEQSINLSGYQLKEDGKGLIPLDKLALIDTNAAAVATNATAIQTEKTQREAADGALDTRVTALEGASSTATEAIEALDTRLDTVESDITTIENTVAANKTELDGDISALNTKVDANIAEIQAVKDKYTFATTEVKTVSEIKF